MRKSSIKVYLTKEEKEEIETAAEKQRKSSSSYLYDLHKRNSEKENSKT